MAVKKETEGEASPKELWEQELVSPVSMKVFGKDTEQVEKIILFGESSAGKTRWYLNILNYLKKQGVKKEKILMCIVYPDRPTGLSKLFNLIPKEFLDQVIIYPVNNYEEMVSSTAQAEQKLKDHHAKTGVHGWLVCELLEEAWKNAQDYYSRQAYGVGLGEYFAQKRQTIKALKEDSSAYRSLEGWGDWPVIKYFHNYNWIDKIKRFPFNVVFTSEIKDEGNKDSIFYDLGYRPAGEKDNLHRVDTILYLSHKADKYYQRCFKLTGYNRLYSNIEITDKNGYEVHKQVLKKFEKSGYKTSAILEAEQEAGIKPPKQENKENKEKQENPAEKKEEKKPKEKESKEEDPWAL